MPPGSESRIILRCAMLPDLQCDQALAPTPPLSPVGTAVYHAQSPAAQLKRYLLGVAAACRT